MKKLSFLLALSGLLIGFIVIIRFVPQPSSDQNSQVLGAPNQPENYTNSFDFVFENQALRAYWVKIPDPSRLFLYDNLSTQSVASDLFHNHRCRILTSAAFYSPDKTPLGLFISERETLSPFVPNPLFDAVFSVNLLETPRITRTPPQDPLRLALQSGPLLLKNASPLVLSLINDKPARRVIIAVDGANAVYFIVLYQPDSVFSGPRLSSLPAILSDFQTQTGILLADALNLDGGTASAFYSDSLKLSEASLIGSYFCLK